MATYYVRKTGSDAAAGTSRALAWLTIGKALGAAGIASGDTLWIGAGTYRETVVVNMTSATAETKVYGDVTGAMTGDAGEVIWSGFTTNDTTASSVSALLNLNTRDFLTIQDIVFVMGGKAIAASGASSSDIVVRRCTFLTSVTTNIAIDIEPGANFALNWVIDSCFFLKNGTSSIFFLSQRPTGADFNLNVVIKNCMFVGGNGTGVTITSGGANTFNPGGITIYNCTDLGSGNFVATGANTSTTIACYVYNCIAATGTSVCLNANALGQIVQDYNIIYSSTPFTNVAVGAHSITDASYAPMMFTGGEFYSGKQELRPFGMPRPGSPLLGFGNQAGSPTTDILGTNRPASAGVGCYELSNAIDIRLKRTRRFNLKQPKSRTQ